MAHNEDADCTLDVSDSCTVCRVFHGDPCPDCGGRGFHKETCKKQRPLYRYSDRHKAVLEVAEILRQSFLVRRGQAITEEIARERANNAAQAIEEYIQPVTK
jgi:hypothetical protein